MRVLIAALLLGLSACGSAQRLEAWRSDQALFTAAVGVTPAMPIAALLLGRAYLSQGQWPQARDWTLKAAALSEARPMPPKATWSQTLTHRIGSQLVVIDAFLPVCDQPAWARWCV